MTVKISGNSSSSTPSFAGDDGDSGLHATADQVQLVTNGTVGVTVDSSQNVGIATDNPGTRLDVISTASASTPISRFKSGTAAGDRGVEIASDANSNVFLQTIRGSDNASNFQLCLNPNGGNVGIGTTSPDGQLHVAGAGNAITRIQSTDDNQAIVNFSGSSGTALGQILYNVPSNYMRFYVNGSEAARIDSSRRLLVGPTSSLNSGCVFQTHGDTIRDWAIKYTGTSGNAETGIRWLDKNNFVNAQVSNSLQNDGLGAQAAHLVFKTANGGSLTERMRIHDTGYMNAGGFLGSDNRHRLNGINALQGTLITTISAYQTSGGTNSDTAEFFSVIYSGVVPSTAATAMKVYRNSGTFRSISANGTINASGADYAEYMLKAGDFTIAKGDVCGVNAEGKLTNVFADAISFVVKSTDPSYVGGDVWHKDVGEEPGGYNDNRTEEEIAEAKVVYEQNLEAARQKVDRIAFAGQVPVNVTGTTPGQYIVPSETADGGIEGVAKNEADLTLAEYMRAVGKVIAIEDDGRARIIVKVA